jgi:hypothetical protein
MSGDLGSRPADYDPSSWLEQSVTKEVLHNSYNIYNNLPAETSLPIDEQDVKKHLVYLSQVIRDSKASSAIGVIALHQHETLLPNHSFVGNTEQLDDERYAYYIQKSANERINIDKVCGYKFAYVEGKGLCPFEFRQGQMPDLSGVDKTFVPRIVQYLVKYHLTSRLGLGLLIPEISKNKMTEFPMRWGMVLVPTELLPKNLTTVTTEWHWDPPTRIFGPETNCVILRSGKHVEPVPDNEEPINFDDIVRLLVRSSMLPLHLWPKSV